MLRDDVAAVLAEVLTADSAIGKTFNWLPATPRSTRPSRALLEPRCKQILDRVRSIPPGCVSTYGDVSPGAPRRAARSCTRAT